MQQEIGDGVRADVEGNGHPRGQQAEEDDQDDDELETLAHDRRFRTSSTTALPRTMSSIVAPGPLPVSGIQSGVASIVLACASRRYELMTNCTKYQLVSAI